MLDQTKYSIEGHEGEWIIQHSWVSDLGYIMVAFYNLDRKVTMNVNTRTKIEQAFQPLSIQRLDPEETNPPNLDIMY